MLRPSRTPTRGTQHVGSCKGAWSDWATGQCLGWTRRRRRAQWGASQCSFLPDADSLWERFQLLSGKRPVASGLSFDTSLERRHRSYQERRIFGGQ